MSDIDDILDTLDNKPKNNYNIVTLKFDMTDVQNLLEILNWAQQASAFMAEMEAIKGTEKSKILLTHYSSFTKDLIKYITKSIKVGEPSSKIVN